MMEFFRPPARGFTVPMLATLASAASRACSSGVKSGSGMLPGATPLGFRARTRSRISAITPASSSPLESAMLTARFFIPTGSHFGKHTSSRRELPDERRFHRLAGLHHIAQKPVHHVLLEDSQVAIGEHIHLERLQLQTQFIRDIAQREFAMIRQAGLGANGRELRRRHVHRCTDVSFREGHFAARSVRDSRSRKSPTSVTTPTAWPVPRSLTLVATAGLMSTQTIFTQLGSMFPTAIECSMEPRHSTSPAPFRCSA